MKKVMSLLFNLTKINFKAPNLVSVLENEKILKIGHFLRFDKNALEFFLKCKMKNIFDTKIASKIVRTYTDSHGLKKFSSRILQ